VFVEPEASGPLRTLATVVPIKRPPRPVESELTEPIIRAICRWIEVSALTGLEEFVAAYLYEETYATPMLALEQLENRYALSEGELRRSYSDRLSHLIERQRRLEVNSGSFTADLDDPVEILARVPKNEKLEVFLSCLPEPELLTALDVYVPVPPEYLTVDVDRTIREGRVIAAARSDP
jgi:hypothetical protein